MLTITNQISSIQNSVEHFFLNNQTHFDISGLQRTTISILGALTVLTEFDNDVSFEEQINAFNKNYFMMIDSLTLGEYISDDLYNYYTFHEHEEEIIFENIQKSYNFLCEPEKINNLSEIIFSHTKKGLKKDKELMLKKLSYYISLDYISSHEINKISMFINEKYENSEDFYAKLASDLLKEFVKEIEVFYGEKVKESFIIESELYDIDDDCWVQLINKYQKENKTNYDLIYAIVDKEKLFTFSKIFLQRYKNVIYNDEIDLFNNILVNLFYNLIKKRFLN